MRHLVSRAIGGLVALSLLLPSAGFATKLDKAEQAAAISIAARGKAQAGDFKTCAELYHQAWLMDASERGYLYSAARCEQKAGLLTRASQDYARYLDGATANDALAQKARAHQIEVQAALRREAATKARVEALKRADQQREAARKASQARSQAAQKAKMTAMAKKGSAATTARPMAWSGVGGGVAVAAVGGWLLWSASSSIATLEGQLANKQDGRIVGISHEKATAAQSSANVRAGAGIAMVGVGLAAMGFGTWLLLRKQTSVSVAPMGAGASLLVRF